MDMKLTFNEKGVSGIVTAVLMIALVMGAVVVVWTVVNNLVTNQLTGAESCVGSYGKVSINSLYTCYNTTSNNFQFSVTVGDVDLDAVLVSISGEGLTKSYTITNQGQTFTNLANYTYGVYGTDLVKAPGKNAGNTYLENTFTKAPDLIEIAMIVGGKQCDVSDSISQIDSCFSLA